MPSKDPGVPGRAMPLRAPAVLETVTLEDPGLCGVTGRRRARVTLNAAPNCPYSLEKAAGLGVCLSTTFLRVFFAMRVGGTDLPRCRLKYEAVKSPLSRRCRVTLLLWAGVRAWNASVLDRG